MDGWMSGRMGGSGKAGLRIAYSNQKVQFAQAYISCCDDKIKKIWRLIVLSSSQILFLEFLFCVMQKTIFRKEIFCQKFIVKTN